MQEFEIDNSPVHFKYLAIFEFSYKKTKAQGQTNLNKKRLKSADMQTYPDPTHFNKKIDI